MMSDFAEQKPKSDIINPKYTEGAIFFEMAVFFSYFCSKYED